MSMCVYLCACVKNSNKKFYIYHKIPTKKNKKKNTSQKWMKWDLFICYMYVCMYVCGFFVIYVHMYVCDIFVILYYLFIVDLCDYVYVYENVSVHVFLGF